ncbi:NTP transferase domain-containing protein [Metabacillus litoralis]|uniref:nucleotidyltransferase family protein n=1 Tax=Metabacillus litoralis TaxID=152268 RepID=UPI001CFD2B4D|nr:nucleotidyltransferase family protein [Metabacillus litoralis]
MKKIIGIYLAAGNSSRMGTCKLSLPFGKETLGTFALNEIMSSMVDYLLIITKKQEGISWLRNSRSLQSSSDKWECVVNEHSSEGQSNSLRLGVLRAMQLNAKSVIVFLADQPFITLERINKLILTSKHVEDYVASSIHGVLKPPILFHDTVFDQLLKISGDQGARSLLKKSIFLGKNVEGEKNELFDIDTLGNYFYAKNNLLSWYENHHFMKIGDKS